MKKTVVYHIARHLYGGAGIAAKRLFDSLGNFQELDVRFYAENYSPEKGYYQYSPLKPHSLNTRIKNKLGFAGSEGHSIHKELSRYMEGRPEGLEDFSPAFLDYRTPPPSPLPDIIHLHWLGSYLDFPSFFGGLPTEIPVVWTLHDMNPFTGGCHYSKGCLKFETVCESCPQLGSYAKHDLANYNFKIKDAVFEGRKLHIVADSIWLKERATKSDLFRNAKSIETIHYGLNNVTYSPRDKISCRNSLGIEPRENDFVLCFGANEITTVRKGMRELMTAIDLLCERGLSITCLIFGFGHFRSEKNIRFLQFGNISSEILLNIIYNAADVFVMPSLEEAFGQTCLEAMSCGVPVVAFDTGGIPDMITDHETGILAKHGDPNDLADKIEYLLLNHDLRTKIGSNSRERVVSDFDLHKQATKYVELYRNI